MADEDQKLHGTPEYLKLRTKEAFARTPMRINIPMEFYFEAPDGTTYRIPDDKVPARAFDRVMTFLMEGPEGLEKPPSNPQPNNKVGSLLPPPSAQEDGKTKPS